MAKEWARRFYNSKAWKACRQSYIDKRIQLDGGLCEECKKTVGEELHHILPLKITNIDDCEITLNHKNLMWLCKDCHFKKHRDIVFKQFQFNDYSKILNNGCYIDEDGMPRPQKVYIVYGSPASGKTTYVKNNKKEGDLIVDLDYIKQAITMSDKTSCNDNLLPIVMDIKDLLYKKIIDKEVDCKNIWVISSLPIKDERIKLQNELGAELIYIESNYKECIERANNDNKRKDKEMQKYIIDKWWDKYQA